MTIYTALYDATVAERVSDGNDAREVIEKHYAITTEELEALQDKYSSDDAYGNNQYRVYAILLGYNTD